MYIEIKNISKSYGNKKVLDGINLRIPKGSLFGLLGPNGAGKSTLINILNNIVQCDGGAISIFGDDFFTDNQQIKQKTSYIPQTYAFYPDLTTIENLEFFGALYGLKNEDLQKQIEFCIDFTSLQNYRNIRAKNYSGGVKRRLNIAIGLLNNPEIIYFDEPTTGIDPQSRNYILQMIKKLNTQQNTTVIYTSHYMEEVEFLCDEIAILDNQTIVYQNKKSDMLEEIKKVEIVLKDESKILIDVSQNYDEFSTYVASCRENIKYIDYKNRNLEELFLKLTKQDLRD